MEQAPTEKSARLDDTIYHPLSAGEHVRLIKPATSQAESSLGWLSDPEVGQYMGADFSNISIDTETKRYKT